MLGVDTDVALDGRLLGKPADEAGARERLEALSGRTHEVLSGVVVARHGDRRRGPGRALGDRPHRGHLRATSTGATIDLYVASGEWRDRAGAYAIQGLGSILIESIRGDFSNVVGLPVGRCSLQLAPKPPARSAKHRKTLRRTFSLRVFRRRSITA